MRTLTPCTEFSRSVSNCKCSARKCAFANIYDSVNLALHPEPIYCIHRTFSSQVLSYSPAGSPGVSKFSPRPTSFPKCGEF